MAKDNKVIIIVVTVLIGLVCSSSATHHDSHSHDDPSSVYTASPICDSCLEFLSWLRSKLLSQDLKTYVDQLIDPFCESTPIEKECKSALEKLYHAMTTRVEKVKPQELCEATSFCPKKLQCPQTSIPNISCDTCKTGIKDFLDMLKNPEVTSMINSAMKQACEVIPSDTLKEQCTKFFSGPFEKWLQALGNHVDAAKMCELFELCDEDLKASFPVADSRTCDVCTKAIKTIQKLVESKEFVDRIKDLLNKACLLSIYHVPECRETANKTVNRILEIVTSAKGRDICEDIHLCS